MRIGLIARADNRGIGFQTWEFYRHVRPAKVAVVNITDPRAPRFENHFDRYPGAEVWDLDDGLLDEQQVRDWLSGLDVVFTVETFYDWRIVSWARSARVKTVVQGNPEFYRHELPTRHRADHPDAWWWPTTWRLESLPRGRVVPVPIPDDAPRVAAPSDTDELNVVHVAGHAAHADRNGTLIVQRVVQRLRPGINLRIVGQDGDLPRIDAPKGVNVTVEPAGVADRWDLYRDAHVLLMPRRYGGLCLPALEGFAAGVVVAMPTCPPNQEWPIFGLRFTQRQAINVPAGRVFHAECDPNMVAQSLTSLNADRGRLQRFAMHGSEWADRNRWANLLPTYEACFAEVLRS